MSDWQQLIDDYERENSGRNLTEEQVTEDLKEILPEAHSIAGKRGRHLVIKEVAQRMAHFDPKFVDSVEDFTDLPK